MHTAQDTPVDPGSILQSVTTPLIIFASPVARRQTPLITSRNLLFCRFFWSFPPAAKAASNRALMSLDCFSSSAFFWFLRRRQKNQMMKPSTNAPHTRRRLVSQAMDRIYASTYGPSPRKGPCWLHTIALSHRPDSAGRVSCEGEPRRGDRYVRA